MHTFVAKEFQPAPLSVYVFADNDTRFLLAYDVAGKEIRLRTIVNFNSDCSINMYLVGIPSIVQNIVQNHKHIHIHTSM